MNKETKAIYISMLSGDYSMILDGPIRDCIDDYSISTLSVWPGAPFSRVILKYMIHNTKMDGISK